MNYELFRIHFHYIFATNCSRRIIGINQDLEKRGRPTIASTTPSQRPLSPLRPVRGGCWRGDDALPHHPRPRGQPRPLLHPVRRLAPEVRPLRPGHQLPHRAPRPGEAQDRPDPPPHRGHDGPVREGSSVSLVGSWIAIEDWIWILSCLCPTSPHVDPQVRLFKTRLPLGFCQDCSCRLTTGEL